MITFEKNKMVIELPTDGCPIEEWLQTHTDMVELLQAEEVQMHQRRWHYLELLKHLVPDWNTAQKMIECKK